MPELFSVQGRKMPSAACVLGFFGAALALSNLLRKLGDSDRVDGMLDADCAEGQARGHAATF
eukprot:scaffold35658_cov21-Prasinocladus_malaysianus.AAC.1